MKKQTGLNIILISILILLLALVYFLGAGLFGAHELVQESQAGSDPVEPGLKGKTVVIDPGHGGFDPGAMTDEVKEADVNMKMAESLKKILEEKGVKVVLTREGNQGLVTDETMTQAEQSALLVKRKQFAWDKGGQFLISLHCNSHPQASVSGAIVFYADEQSKALAETIQAKLDTVTSRPRPVEMRGFTIISGARMPSVLIEAGFITHKKDLELLTKHPEIVAEKIFEGLDEYASRVYPPEAGGSGKN